jgi:hypothetical protein
MRSLIKAIVDCHVLQYYNAVGLALRDDHGLLIFGSIAAVSVALLWFYPWVAAPSAAFHRDDPARFRAGSHRPSAEVLGTPESFDLADLRRDQPAGSRGQLHPGAGREAVVARHAFDALLGRHFGLR